MGQSVHLFIPRTILSLHVVSGEEGRKREREKKTKKTRELVSERDGDEDGEVAGREGVAWRRRDKNRQDHMVTSTHHSFLF